MCKVISVRSQWGSWSRCSRSCNGGTKTRYRQCLGAKYPHIKCGLEKSQTVSCNPQPCQYSQWTQWGEWSKCTGSNLRQVRKRECMSFDRLKCKGTINVFLEAFFIICDVLSDLLPFVQFKKREKHPRRSVNFSKVAGFSLQLY